MEHKTLSPVNDHVSLMYETIAEMSWDIAWLKENEMLQAVSSKDLIDATIQWASNFCEYWEKLSETEKSTQDIGLLRTRYAQRKAMSEFGYDTNRPVFYVSSETKNFSRTIVIPENEKPGSDTVPDPLLFDAKTTYSVTFEDGTEMDVVYHPGGLETEGELQGPWTEATLYKSGILVAGKATPSFGGTISLVDKDMNVYSVTIFFERRNE